MHIIKPFPANYDAEIAPELPSSGGGVRYFPAIKSWQSQLYEAALKFTYGDHPSWFGVFAARSRNTRGLNVTSTMPEPDSCLVACIGTGFVVNVAERDRWQAIEMYPVLGIEPISEHQLLLINNFTRMIAFGVNGIRWETQRLCSDELRIASVESGVIKCEGWDAPTDSSVSLSVDVVSGETISRVNK
jgi:hypothetical protein